MTTPRSQPDSGGSTIWIVGLAVVVALGVIAVVVARSAGDDPEPVEGQTGEVQLGTAAEDRGDDPATTEAGDTTTTPEATASSDSLPLLPEGGADPAVGMTIPTVSGTTLDGEDLTIGPDGTAKVIVFLAHWCPACQQEVPAIVEYLEENDLPEGVELVSVSTAVDPSRDNYPPSAWLDDEGWTAPVLADSESGAAAAAYGLPGFPYFVVVDDEGRVVARASAVLDGPQLAALFDAAAGA
jgi:cytochrome c biogenesis protein CcmG, thiol:disulfide interchange protein DsbE